MGNLRRVKKRFINMNSRMKKRFVKDNPLSQIEIQTIKTKKNKNAKNPANQKLSV